jgi:hypothetical protein
VVVVVYCYYVVKEYELLEVSLAKYMYFHSWVINNLKCTTEVLGPE